MSELEPLGRLSTGSSPREGVGGGPISCGLPREDGRKVLKGGLLGSQTSSLVYLFNPQFSMWLTPPAPYRKPLLDSPENNLPIWCGGWGGPTTQSPAEGTRTSTLSTLLINPPFLTSMYFQCLQVHPVPEPFEDPGV